MTQKKVPHRMCLGCREMKPKKELIRIVRSPAGEVFVDDTFKAPGRGAYVCRSKICYNKCVKAKAFSRQFGCAVSDGILAEIGEKIEL